MTKTFATLLAVLFLLPSIAFGQACSNWLYLPPSTNSRVEIGNLSITGDQLTVEAEFCRTTNYDPQWNGGDLVGKYTDQTNNNYLLRCNLAGLTTTTGFHQVVSPCPFQLNMTYHVAMVYDGASLSFYQNGQLVAQTPASGNLITQNIISAIGIYTAAYSPTAFEGYINEVRIWNVARTQAQIQANMFTTLSSPTRLRRPACWPTTASTMPRINKGIPPGMAC